MKISISVRFTQEFQIIYYILYTYKYSREAEIGKWQKETKNESLITKSQSEEHLLLAAATEKKILSVIMKLTKKKQKHIVNKCNNNNKTKLHTKLNRFCFAINWILCKIYHRDLIKSQPFYFFFVFFFLFYAKNVSNAIITTIFTFLFRQVFLFLNI